MNSYVMPWQMAKQSPLPYKATFGWLQASWYSFRIYHAWEEAQRGQWVSFQVETTKSPTESKSSGKGVAGILYSIRQAAGRALNKTPLSSTPAAP